MSDLIKNFEELLAKTVRSITNESIENLLKTNNIVNGNEADSFQANRDEADNYKLLANTVLPSNNFKSFGYGYEHYKENGKYFYQGYLYRFRQASTDLIWDNTNRAWINQGTHGIGFGMECNATTLMYALQSYGLIPPLMSREEFEWGFCPFKKSLMNQEQLNVEPTKVKLYVMFESANTFFVNQDSIPKTKPLKDTFDKLYGSNALYYLKGIESLIPPLHPESPNATSTLSNIYWTFYNLASNPNDNFLKKFHSVKWSQAPNVINIYEDLKEGKLKDAYFSKPSSEGGFISRYSRLIQNNVIYAGISLTDAPNIEHFVLIVGNYIHKFVYDNIDYYLYPIDDSWHENAVICIPNLSIYKLKGIFKDKYFCKITLHYFSYNVLIINVLAN